MKRKCVLAILFVLVISFVFLSCSKHKHTFDRGVCTSCGYNAVVGNWAIDGDYIYSKMLEYHNEKEIPLFNEMYSSVHKIPIEDLEKDSLYKETFDEYQAKYKNYARTAVDKVKALVSFRITEDNKCLVYVGGIEQAYDYTISPAGAMAIKDGTMPIEDFGFFNEDYSVFTSSTFIDSRTQQIGIFELRFKKAQEK